MNDKFSWKRFGWLVRSEMVGERRGLLLQLGGFALLCLLMYSLWNINAIFGQKFLESAILFPRLIVIVCFAIFVFFNLSASFKRFFSRDRASAAFMLPAVRGEKFLYVVLKNMVIVPLVLLLILLANDLFWGSVFGFDDLAGIYWEIIVREWNAMFAQSLFWGLVNCFALMAFFLAGAVVFRRRQYWWTLLAIFVLNIPAIILFQIEPRAVNIFERSFDSMGGMLVLNGITLCWGIGWMYVAWRRFSTLQITK